MGSSESFRPGDRIRKRSEFLRVQGHGRRFVTPHFLIFVLNAERERTRIGITVSKRVGDAVVRNRVKRLVREAFRRNKTLFPRGKDIVFVAKRGATDASYEAILRALGKVAKEW